MGNYKKKLQKLIDNNKELRPTLLKEFPELEDTSPFIYTGGIFMRKGRNTSLYTLIKVNHSYTVRNIEYNNLWSGKLNIKKTKSYEKGNPTYLTKKEFKILLKASSINIDSILVVKEDSIIRMYDSLLWNKKEKNCL